MKFIIEVDDFWLDEDEDIAPALRSHNGNYSADLYMETNAFDA